MLNILAFDIETTGLFPKEHTILEVAYAAVQVESNGNVEIDSVHHALVKVPIFIAKSHMDEKVFKMHTENGLLEEIEKSKKGKLLLDIQNDILKYILDCFGNSKPQLCGNSIAFDRDFIKLKMPQLDSALHYRMIDLSCIRTLAKYFGNYTFAEGGSNHRAADDCKYILDQLTLIRGLLSKINTEGE